MLRNSARRKRLFPAIAKSNKFRNALICVFSAFPTERAFVAHIWTHEIQDIQSVFLLIFSWTDDTCEVGVILFTSCEQGNADSNCFVIFEGQSKSLAGY